MEKAGEHKVKGQLIGQRDIQVSLDMDIAGESICVLSQRWMEQIAAIS